MSQSAGPSVVPAAGAHPLAGAGLDGEHHRGRCLLVGLRERGMGTTKPILAVLDGAKALSAGVHEVFDHPVIARCQIHKLRNVRDHLPEKMRGLVQRRMRAA